MKFLQSFHFSSKYREGKISVIADALSRRYTLLATLDVRLFGFGTLKDYYGDDVDFEEIFEKYAGGLNGE